MTIESPCIEVCAVDPFSGRCAGCGRTLAEIAGWLRSIGAERGRFLQELPHRRASAAARCAATGVSG